MSVCACRPAPADRCRSGRPGLHCSLPAGHPGAHAHCVHSVWHTEHHAYEWNDQ